MTARCDTDQLGRAAGERSIAFARDNRSLRLAATACRMPTATMRPAG
jgi:hypothetical protein